MVHLTFRIQFPVDRWKSVWRISGKTLVSHKCWEFEIFETSDLIALNFSLTSGKDHAGLGLEFAILGYSAEFIVYDTRHWDYENKCWEENNE